MNFEVDGFGKVTVSLGGQCPLKCMHCYTTATQFMTTSRRTVGQVIEELKSLGDQFSTICISGDTDCFIRPALGLELIQQAAMSFPWTNIMFTSRLVPKEEIVHSIISLGQEMAKSRRLLIPCVSVVSYSYPNEVENPRIVPPTSARIDLLQRFTQGGLPCFLAMRPTFPFRVVPKSEVTSLVESAVGKAAVVLGEAFILDPAGEIASHLGLPLATDSELGSSPLTFLPQPGLWEKRLLTEETEFTRAVCEMHRLPYFLRSMSAVSYLVRYWDFDSSLSSYRPGDPIDRSIDSLLP